MNENTAQYLIPPAQNISNDTVLHSQFVQYGRNAKEWLRRCALLLPEIDEREIWRKKGFSSLYEYAAKLAGMSRSSVDEALRVLRRIQDKPELQQIVQEKGIQSVRPVAAISTPETAGFWAKKARAMSKNTLEVYVREFKKQSGESIISSEFERAVLLAAIKNAELEREAVAHGLEREQEALEHGQEREQKTAIGEARRGIFATRQVEILPREEMLIMSLDPAVADELKKLKGQGSWNELMKEFLELRKQKLEKAKPEAVETESRHIPTNIKTFVIQKTRGQCAYPGCVKPYQILHHTQRWALEKTHDPDRLVPLCKAHERIAHHSLIAHEDQPTQQWKILKEPVWWELKNAVDRTIAEYRKIPAKPQ